jgi:hypothetical protein
LPRRPEYEGGFIKEDNGQLLAKRRGAQILGGGGTEYPPHTSQLITRANEMQVPRRMSPARATERARRRKTFSLAAIASLLLLAMIGTSACLYTPPIPEDETAIPGWQENKVQLQKNGINLGQSAHKDQEADGRQAAREHSAISSSEVASLVAAKP